MTFTRRGTLKVSLAVLGSLAIAGIVFVAGSITAVSRGWGQAIVFVNVINESKQGVRDFTVDIDSCGYKSAIQGGALALGRSRQIKYTVCGEGLQIFRATFLDGKVVTSGDYVEGGYRLTEKISRQAVRNDIDSIAGW